MKSSFIEAHTTFQSVKLMLYKKVCAYKPRIKNQTGTEQKK